jgi:hypothetical protein
MNYSVYRLPCLPRDVSGAQADYLLVSSAKEEQQVSMSQISSDGDCIGRQLLTLQISYQVLPIIVIAQCK